MSYWKLAKGRWGGITARGKRFIVKSASAAKAKIGKGTSKSRKTSGKSMAKKTKGRGQRGTRIIGAMGWKGVLISAAMLFGAKFLVRRFAPQVGAYTTSIAALGTGALAKGADLPGKSTLAFGAIDGISELVYDLLTPNGLVTFPTIGVAARPISARYDVA